MGASADPMRTRRGFTLVELLVVIVIIGILTGLVTGAAIMARRRARITAAKMEIADLDKAVQQYRQKYGEFPPDFSNLRNPDTTPGGLRDEARNLVLSHLRRVFPRYTPVGDTTTPSNTPDLWSKFRYDVMSYGNSLDGTTNNKLDPDLFDQATALAFWLGGLPDGVSGNYVPAGFSADVRFPFRKGLPRTERFFEFAADRFVMYETDPSPLASHAAVRCMRYYPSGLNIQGSNALGANAATVTSEAAPYVYFRARRLPAAGGRYEYATVDNVANPTAILPLYYRHGPGATENVCVPYLDEYPGPSPYWIPDTTTPKPAPAATNVSSTNGMSSRELIRRWRNLETCQIISPGMDGLYGAITSLADSPLDPLRFRFSRSGNNFAANGEDFDNIANFTTQGTIEDEMQK